MHRRMDRLATTWIQSFLDSAFFRFCLLNRRAMAVLLQLSWTSCSFAAYCSLRKERPGLVESLTFLFLIALPMGTCLYFTCGFHVVDNITKYTVVDRMKDVQIANPFDRKLWVPEIDSTDSEEERAEDCVPLLLLQETDHHDNLNRDSKEDVLERTNPCTPTTQHSLNV